MEAGENGASTDKPLSEREKLKKKQDDAMKRAAGHLPPERDEVSGKMINPHNPEFITKVPWYLGESGPTLKHHADQKSNGELSMVDADNLFARKHATQVLMKQQSQKVGYRKGACKNCGSMTHKEKDCVERPRSKKKAAVNSGMDIAHDEVVLDLKEYGKVGYSAKRDTWQGYDADEYQNNIEKYKRIEAERRRIKKEEKAARKQKESEKEKGAEEDDKKGSKERKDGDDSGSEINDSDDTDDGDGDSDDGDDDEDETGVSKKELLAADEQQRDFQGRMARQGGVGGNQMMVTARNLRIREDKPKYLRNLDLNSAHYDPKSRSMRANPTPGVNPADLDFAGDNFHRQTGDAVELAQAQVLAWEMEGHVNPAGGAGGGSGGGQGGIDIIANPSAAALATKQYKEEKEHTAQEKQARLADRYGDASAAKNQKRGSEAGAGTGGTLDERLRLGQTEVYREYTVDAAGRVVQKDPSATGTTVGGRTGVPVTKYQEDVLEGNHTAVWGSWYDRGTQQWGYACCWSTLRGSYCTGQAGKDAITASSAGLSRLMEEKRRGAPSSSSSSSSGAGVAAGMGLDEAKTSEALARAQRWQAENMEGGGEKADKKKKKKRKKEREEGDDGEEGMSGKALGHFQAKRVREGDPMAGLVRGSGEGDGVS